MVDCDINKINSAIKNNIIKLQHFNNYVFKTFFTNTNDNNTKIMHFNRIDKSRYWVIICEKYDGGVEHFSVGTHVREDETLVLKVRRMSKEKFTSTSKELPSLCSLHICPNFK